MSAPALVFIHGFLGSLNDWGDLPRRIAPDRWHTLVELPGHGDEAYAPPEAFSLEGCVKAMLDHIHAAAIDRFVVVGYSMGGRIGLHLARAAGPRCAGAVIESAGPGLAGEAERAERHKHDEAWARWFESEPMEQALATWYRQPVFASLAAKHDLVRRLIASRRRNRPEGVARALRELGAGRVPSLWDRLGGFEFPVLFIAGEQDPKYAEIAGRAAALCRKGSVAIVPGAGHSVHVENPEGFCGAVRKFLGDAGC